MSIDRHPPRVRDGGMPQMDFVASLVRALRSSRAVMPQLSRYALVSALALAVDFTVFLVLNGMLGYPTLSGVAGYACGIIVHYQFSRRFVFDAARCEKSSHRLFSEFVASGLLGLAITAGIIAFATSALGLAPIAAKVLAAGASFIGVFLIRRTVVFA
jgi:putative flippase GtrA